MNITTNSTFAVAVELPVPLPLEVKTFLITTFGTVWMESSCTQSDDFGTSPSFAGELAFIMEVVFLMDSELEMMRPTQLSFQLALCQNSFN